uniref:HP domain-containing protein n=1 Tax=Nothobranchius rachovii TaxID=451742 RepID=A0A1A8NS73_9TELE
MFGRTEETEAMKVSASSRKERRGEGKLAAPWRQRARNRRETIACTPVRPSPEQETLQEEKKLQTVLQEQKVSSAGNHVDVNVVSSVESDTAESFAPFSSLMLIHIKGRRHVQVRLVEPSVRSLNSGDSFLLVTPEHCILWSGEFSNEQERSKAFELGSFIQSQRDLGCSASAVVHLDEELSSDSSAAADFWSLLGGRKQYRGAGAPEEDELFEQGVVESNWVNVQRGHGVLMLDDGHQMEVKTVAVDTWHVQEFDDSEIPVESSGQLHEGDSYVIRWTFSISAVDDKKILEECENSPGSKENTAFFLWRGRHSNASGQDTAAFLSIGTNANEKSQVVVPQGEEPPCFLQLFRGGLVIHRGKREEASTCAEWRLFCVRGELPEEGSGTDGDCCCASLRSRGSVVLLNSQQGALYLWNGCKAHSSVREVSKRAVERLTEMCPPELGLNKTSPVKMHVVEEGSEPAEFWTALGQMDRKAYDCMLQDPGKYNFTPRLFHLSSSSSRFEAKELQSPTRLPGLVMALPFLQESLYSVPQPALFLLDNRLEVYLWQRCQPEQTESSASARSLWHSERRCAMQTALQFCKEMNPRRPPQAYLIFEGSEPLTFTNVFPRWENLRPLTRSDSGQVKLTLVQDALAQLMEPQYPLEELLRSPLPEGVDPQHLEVYLSDQDFQTVLEIKRDEYASLPSWKQTDLKKSKGLLC